MKRQKIVWKIYCDICFLPFSRTDSLARHKTNRSCTKEAVSQPVLQKGIISEDQGNLLRGIDKKTGKRERKFKLFGYVRVPELFRMTNILNINNSEGMTIFGRNDNIRKE